MVAKSGLIDLGSNSGFVTFSFDLGQVTTILCVSVFSSVKGMNGGSYHNSGEDGRQSERKCLGG